MGVGVHRHRRVLNDITAGGTNIDEDERRKSDTNSKALTLNKRKGKKKLYRDQTNERMFKRKNNECKQNQKERARGTDDAQRDRLKRE